MLRNQGEENMEHKSFVATGANFRNKGALSMLLVTVTELRSRFPGCDIFMITNEDNIVEIQPTVSVKMLSAHISDWQYVQGGWNAFIATVKAIVKCLKGNRNAIKNMKHLAEVMTDADALIDISGFSLSSQWGCDATIKYTNMLHATKAKKLPVFIMPQSFGPFDYTERKDEMIRLLKTYLSYPVRVFAREQEGYDRLKDELQLKNISLSPDLVLENREVRPQELFTNDIKVKLPKIESKKNVAIIPNIRSFENTNADILKELYLKIVENLATKGIDIYFLSHSTEDLPICAALYESVKESYKDRVHLIEKDLSPLEFSSIVSDFEFVIASRYHAIVHSYKAGVPAVVLGWAEKYNSLLALANQTNFMFDVRGIIDCKKIQDSVDLMLDEVKTQHKNIKEAVEKLQSNNCFDCITEYFNGTRNEQ